MTSSLVGSEMCIRDRHGTGRGSTTREPESKQSWADHRQKGKQTRRSTTVSYTHLTLPTICSV
eukprot:2605095-Prorocentrum_lima.AAC.1